MKDDLKTRIETFAKSLERVHFLDKVVHIQRFLETELNARDVPYTLTTQDLAIIHSNAVNNSIVAPAIPNASHDLALFWTMGVTNWLRGKDMLYFVIGAKGRENEPINKKPDDKNPNRD